MKVVFLGTSGSMPTPERSSSSVAVKLGRELVIFDCGEGTQRQMVRGKVGFRRETRILLSHMHGDHVLGLPGLLQTMSLLRREKPLHVYGPTGLVDYVRAFSESLGGPSFPVILYEIQEPGVIFTGERYTLEAVRSIHRVESWSYCLTEKPRPGRFHPNRAKELGVPKGSLWHKLQHGEDVEVDGRLVRSSDVIDPARPGRKIAYSGDTRPTEALEKLAEGADLLIHESTFMDELRDRAEEDGHSTVVEAAELAKRAGVTLLALTHISSRYSDPELLLAEALKVFRNVVVAEDLLELEVPLR